MALRIVLAWMCFLVACGGGGGGTPRERCEQDSDCGLGELCEGEVCSPGCRSERDCPAEAPICDPARGTSGSCVVCLEDRDCPGDAACEDGACVATCRSDADCDGQRCDPDGRCVACLSSTDCPLGSVCAADHSCQAGCFGDRDCAAAAPHCAGADEGPGECVACVVDGDCGDHETCVAHACVTSCADDTDCPGQVCDRDSGQCVACNGTADCPLGTLCQAHVCEAGCSGDRDCPGSAPVCDPRAGEHGACFECVADRDCPDADSCEDHVCVSHAPHGEGEPCAATEDCEGALVCDGNGICRSSCNLFMPMCPREGDSCLPDAVGQLTGVCVPPGRVVGAGEACDPSTDSCVTDYMCFDPAEGSDGTCVRPEEVVAARCASAPALVSGTTVSGSLRRSGTSFFESRCRFMDPRGEGHPEKLHRFTLTVRSQVTLSTDDAGTQFDTLLAITEGCGFAASEATCSDDVTPGSNLASTIVIKLDPGSYAAVVDRGFTPEAGEADPTPYRLRYRAIPVVAPGGSCDASGVTSVCDTGLTCTAGHCR